MRGWMRRTLALLCAVCLPFMSLVSYAREPESGQHKDTAIGASGENMMARGFFGSVEEAGPCAQCYEARLDFSLSNGFCSAVGEDLVLPHNTFEFLLVRPVGETLYTPDLYIAVEWDVSEVDPTTSGDYFVTCRPLEPLPYEVAGLNGLRVPYHVVERGKPYLMIASALYDGGAEIWFFEELPPGSTVRFSVSVGDDGSWRTIRHSPHDFLPNQLFLVEELPTLDEIYYFRAEVLNGPMKGTTNALEYLYSSEDYRNDGGGDRTGTDRDGAGDDDNPDEETPQVRPGGMPAPNSGDGGGVSREARSFPDTDLADDVVPVKAKADVAEPASAQQSESTPESAYSAVTPLPMNHPEPEENETSTRLAPAAVMDGEIPPENVPATVTARSSPPESSLPGEPFHTGAAMILSTVAATLLGGVLLVRGIRARRR